MFVGVGAARVRDLFEEARKRAPAIIFIDEIDAIGQRRAGSGAVVSNDEREQTLNQLLAEMDGFDPSVGIVVLAATNRPEVLDPALLRPGRFDRQVTIPLPNVTERAAILAVHCRASGSPPTSTSARSPAARPGSPAPTWPTWPTRRRSSRSATTARCCPRADFDEARDRIILGRREGSNVLLPEEKHAVAVHESGHALVAALSQHADPVAKVTILPAGQTLGVTEQLPLVERHLYGEDYLLDSWPSGLAAGPPSSSCSARDRPGRPTTSPGRPTWRQDGPGVRPVARRSARSATPRAGRFSSAAAGRACPAAVRGGDPGRGRRRGVPAAARGRGTGGRAAQGPPQRARRPGQPAAGDGDRRWRRRLPAGWPA